jgi:hypothetical protein
VDEKDQPVEGAVFGGYWVHPVNKNNNTALFFSGTTDADGIATFKIGDKTYPGEYRITIENVNKEGYVFDCVGSILVGYNSPTQFSQEYKRYFGYAPLAT